MIHWLSRVPCCDQRWLKEAADGIKQQAAQAELSPFNKKYIKKKKEKKKKLLQQ